MEMRHVLLKLATFAAVVAVPRLVAQTAPAESRPARVPALTWKDAETGRVLFTSADIISFDWEKQAILLRRDALLDLMAWAPPHMYQYRRLAVYDQAGLIYNGQWVSGMSSLSFAGPTYEIGNPLVLIRDGYPPRPAPSQAGADPRLAERLRAGLQKDRRLGKVDPAYDFVGLRIGSADVSWKECGPGLKVRVEFFTDTFELGRKARAHIFFSRDPKTDTPIDAISCELRFVANDGTFRSDCRLEGISPTVIDDGIYVCRFDPWQPVEGSDARPRAWVGRVILAVLLQKAGGDKLMTVHRLDFPEVTVPVREAAPMSGE
jgi:hypothetical protein